MLTRCCALKLDVPVKKWTLATHKTVWKCECFCKCSMQWSSAQIQDFKLTGCEFRDRGSLLSSHRLIHWDALQVQLSVMDAHAESDDICKITKHYCHDLCKQCYRKHPKHYLYKTHVKQTVTLDGIFYHLLYFGATTNTSRKPESNESVNTCQDKNRTLVKWNSQRNSRDKTITQTVLSVFTINGLFLPRQPRHNMSRFTAEVRSGCQVDEQSRFHHSWRVTITRSSQVSYHITHCLLLHNYCCT